MKFEKEHFEKLIGEFKEQRIKLNEMVDVLDDCDESLKVMTKGTDHRYRGALEEKFKALAEIYKTKLAIRKEISSNIKDEIELKRKVEMTDEDGNGIGLSNEELMESAAEIENIIRINSKKEKETIDNGINLVEIRRD